MSAGKIVVLEWKCFDLTETEQCFKDMGYEVIPFSHDDYQQIKSEAFLSDFSNMVQKDKPEAAFSYNYFPVLAEACHQCGVKYISFLYDSPYVLLYSFTLMYPTNYVFLFDSSWVEELKSGGLTNVYYMNLPCVSDRIERLEKLEKTGKSRHDSDRTRADVSFVGALYNEAHNLYERMEEKLTPYLKGYLDGLMESQLKVQGFSFTEKLLTPSIIQALQEVFPIQSEPTCAEPPGYRYANYFIDRKITQLERIRLLTALGEKLGDKYLLKLFTLDPDTKFKGVRNMGIAEYNSEMPFVFKDSRINLNISLRSIKCGIPLRCMDILGCGGFLMSNYQADFLIDFIPGQDFVYFEDADDMISKIDYYLSHENERRDIAEAGAHKARTVYSLQSVFNRIFAVADMI